MAPQKPSHPPPHDQARKTHPSVNKSQPQKTKNGFQKKSPGAATDGDGEKCEKLCLRCLSPDRHEHVQTNCATRQVQRLLYSSATTLASCSNFFKLMGELASGEESFMKESVVENFTVTPLSVLT